jgi:zinc protease
MSEELKLSTENARARAYEGIAARCYAPSDWRYAYDPHTLLREVSRVRMADIKKLHALVISSGSASATVGGTEADCHRVAKILRTLPSHVYQEPPSEPLHPPQGITTTLLDIPQKQNIEIVIGAPLPILRTHEDFPALFFGMRVLGYPRGFSGRLMSIVREKEGLTYGIYADLDGITAHTYGLWRITTFFAPKDVLRGITSTLREVERICTEGITEDELTRFKIMISTQLVMLNDSLISRVRTEHTRTLAGITPGEFESFKQAIARLSVDEVNAAMRTHIRAHNSIVSGAGPIRTVSHDIESLRGE